jgi:predicted DsbA family dithiol-disulfide isomerase
MTAGHPDRTAFMQRAIADGAEQTIQPAATRARYVADLVCPWCYIGFRRLIQAMGRRDVDFAWHPFLLNPYLPPEGVTRREYLERKFGSLVQAQVLHRRIAEIGARERIRFAFGAIKQQPNTQRAHAMILAAGAYGLQAALAEKLFDTFFATGADLGDPSVLRAVARQLPLGEAQVEGLLSFAEADEVGRAHERACALGVNGVPVLVLDESHVIAGAQPAEALEAMLDVAAYARQGRHAS